MIAADPPPRLCTSIVILYGTIGVDQPGRMNALPASRAREVIWSTDEDDGRDSDGPEERVCDARLLGVGERSE